MSINNRQVLARASILAVSLSLVLDSAIHKNETIQAGSFLAKLANGKYRAYAEGEVSTAFSTANANFAVDPSDPLVKHFRVGDAIESTSGTALGTILTFNPATGAGTLQANSAANLAVGQSIRITEASASLGLGKGRILESAVVIDSADTPASGYVEGYMIKTVLTTDAAIAKVGVSYDSTEFKMKL